MHKLQITDGIFSLDGKRGQFTLKDCHVVENDQNTFWLPKPYVNALGKSIIALKEPYAAIFPGVENFTQEVFKDMIVKGKILARDSDEAVNGHAYMSINGGNGVCIAISFIITVEQTSNING